MVECPGLTQTVAEMWPVLIAVASGMVVVVGRELEMTGRALGWRMPSALPRLAPAFPALLWAQMGGPT